MEIENNKNNNNNEIGDEEEKYEPKLEEYIMKIILEKIGLE